MGLEVGLFVDGKVLFDVVVFGYGDDVVIRYV